MQSHSSSSPALTRDLPGDEPTRYRAQLVQRTPRAAPCRQPLRSALETDGSDTGAHPRRHILTFPHSVKTGHFFAASICFIRQTCYPNGYVRLHFITSAGHRRRLLSAGYR